MTPIRRGLTVGAGVAAIALAALWWLAAWWWSTLRAPAPANIVVITLDTTRADRLSPYGYMNVSLPHLERLAREGVIFDQATSVAPLTLPAHTSLFTGLLPPNHGVRDNADTPLSDTFTTLAEVLLARRFRTGAFVGSVVLDPDRGLKQGFEQYRGVDEAGRGATEGRQRRADSVMDDAIRWLDTIQGSRFFLWTHLYDAHRPYDPPEPFRSVYGHNLYVGEIAFADSQIGRLLEALEQRNLLAHTVVVVTADHGESLGAHGERDHGIFVYEDVVRVPLIVRAPGLQPFRVGEVVRLTDVMPTILDLLRVPSPPVDGVSLVDLMAGRRSDLNLEAYSESLYPERLGWSALRALRSGQFKLIDAPRPELYDLQQDPFEEKNIYDTRLAATIAARLAAVATGHGAAGTADRRANAAPELQARLGALGYVSSAVKRDPSAPTSLPDPKDCIGHYAGTTDANKSRPECGPRRHTDDGSGRIPPQPLRR
jgi:arylsulfatase A-like enzyme